MPELQFRTKIDLFKKILEKYHPELFKKYKNLFTLLDKIRKFRNKVAHAMLDNSDEFLKKEYTDRIQYFYYEDAQKKIQVIKKDEFIGRLGECSKAIKQIIEIQKVIKPI